jgi:hypothetical protein
MVAPPTAHCSHACTSQVRHFVAPGLGVMGFATVVRYRRELAVALADPLAPRQHWRALAGAFLEHFNGKRVVFLHTSTEFALLLQGAFGLHANDMGGETQLLVQVSGRQGLLRFGSRARWRPSPARSVTLPRSVHAAPQPQEFTCGGKARAARTQARAAARSGLQVRGLGMPERGQVRTPERQNARTGPGGG